MIYYSYLNWLFCFKKGLSFSLFDRFFSFGSILFLGFIFWFYIVFWFVLAIQRHHGSKGKLVNCWTQCKAPFVFLQIVSLDALAAQMSPSLHLVNFSHIYQLIQKRVQTVFVSSSYLIVANVYINLVYQHILLNDCFEIDV